MPIKYDDEKKIKYEKPKKKDFQSKTLGMFETPVDILEGALPVAGGIAGAIGGAALGGPAGAVAGGAGGAGLGETGKQLIERFRGERQKIEPGQIATEAAFGAGGEIGGHALRGAAKLAPHVAESVAPVASKFLSAIPESQTQRLIEMSKQGKDIFKGKIAPQLQKVGKQYQSIKKSFELTPEQQVKEYYRIADRIKAKLLQQNKELGKSTGQLQKQLKDTGKRVNLNPLIQSLREAVKAKSFKGVSTIPEKDLATVNRIIKEIDDLAKSPTAGKGNADIGQLYNLRRKLDNELSQVYRKGEIGTEANALIKTTLNNIRQTIYKNAPDTNLLEANEAFSEFRGDVVDNLFKKLTGKNRDTLIKNIETLAPEELNAIQKIDDLTGGKIGSDIRKIKASEGQAKEISKLIKATDIKNPLNILNKSEEEIEIIRKLNPGLLEDVKDLRARAEFERPLSFQRSPYVADRIGQEEAIQQANIIKTLFGGYGGFTTGGPIGALAGTAATSPRVQAEIIRKLAKPSKIPTGAGAGVGAAIGTAGQPAEAKSLEGGISIKHFVNPDGSTKNLRKIKKERNLR